MQFAVDVHDLQKRYGAVEAVRGIDFQIQIGEVFGLLGPNGAGKTTTVEILEGIRARSSGAVSVLGMDPERQSRNLKDRIGVCLQATNLPDKIRVHEALDLFADLYSRSVDQVALLTRLQLHEKRDAYYSTLSGGQKQRLALALALVNDPQLLFLDEPSAGLDPQARLEIHELVTELRREQRTILLTTHYIEEAERLCDRVAIMNEGRIVAMGTPRELQSQSPGESVISVHCDRALPPDLPEWRDILSSRVSADRTSLSVSSSKPARTLVELVKWIDQQGIGLLDVQLKRPSLEDVFIGLTGTRLRE